MQCPICNTDLKSTMNTIWCPKCGLNEPMPLNFDSWLVEFKAALEVSDYAKMFNTQQKSNGLEEGSVR